MVEQVDHHVCTFCESLPTTTPWSRSGKVSHCPLCHGEILMAGNTTYRIFAEPETITLHNQRHPWRWVMIGVGAAIVAGGVVWVTLANLTGGA